MPCKLRGDGRGLANTWARPLGKTPRPALVGRQFLLPPPMLAIERLGGLQADLAEPGRTAPRAPTSSQPRELSARLVVNSEPVAPMFRTRRYVRGANSTRNPVAGGETWAWSFVQRRPSMADAGTGAPRPETRSRPCGFAPGAAGSKPVRTNGARLRAHSSRFLARSKTGTNWPTPLDSAQR